MNNTYGLSHKIVFASFGLALVSLFFKWVDAGILGSANGFQSWTILMPLVLLYPVIVAYKKETLSKGMGLGFVAGGFVLGIASIMRNNVSFFGESANLSGIGPYIFIVSIVLFAIGVYTQPKSENEQLEDKQEENEQ